MIKQDDGWTSPEEMWKRLAPLLPSHKPHPLGCHNPRVPDRAAMNAIFLYPHWSAVEFTQRHLHLLQRIGVAAIPGVERCGCVRAILAPGLVGGRRITRNELVVVVAGCRMGKGHDNDDVRVLVNDFGFTAHIHAREEALQIKRKAACRGRRWVVERSHSWTNRFHCI